MSQNTACCEKLRNNMQQEPCSVFWGESCEEAPSVPEGCGCLRQRHPLHLLQHRAFITVASVCPGFGWDGSSNTSFNKH